MKLDLQIVLILLIILIVTMITYQLNKKEGMCDASCNASNDCSGTDLSNCIVKPTEKKCPLPAESIKCIADFGTSVGDPLCCGQEGVLQDTRYVCPNTLRKCSNFRCGSAFGTCVAN